MNTMRFPMMGGNQPPQGYDGSGINPGGMYTGGTLPASPFTGMQTGGNFQAHPLYPMTGGALPPMQAPPMHTGGPAQPSVVPNILSGGALPPTAMPLRQRLQNRLAMLHGYGP